MTRLERNANIAAVVIPFVGVIAAAVLLWNHFLGPRDLAIFAVMYLLSAIGVTVGFHRLLTHRAFETRAWLRYTLAVIGSLSLQGGVIDWVADHRKHHTFTDEEGDPHSPHAGAGAGLRGMVSGPVARARGLAVRDPRPGLLETRSRPTSSRTRRCAGSTGGFPLIALGEPARAVPGRARAERRLARRGRPRRRCCGPGSCGSSSCTT